MQLRRRFFEHVDFERGEAVARRLVPVRAAEAVKMEADRVELRLPVGAGLDRAAFHQLPAPCAEAEEPKPPRVTCVLPMEFVPGRGARVVPVGPLAAFTRT